MSYRPTSDEGEDQEMGEPDEGDEQQGEGDGDQLQPLPDPGPCEPESSSVPLPKTLEEVEEHQKVYKTITMHVHMPTIGREECVRSPCWNARTVWYAETPRLPSGKNPHRCWPRVRQQPVQKVVPGEGAG